MEDLFANLPVRNFRRGQILLYEGDSIENIYFLVDGFVKVSNIHHSGNQRTIIIYAPGDAFPMTSFLSGLGVAQYFYECMTDVQVKLMPNQQLLQKIKGNLEVGENLIFYTNKINQQFIERIEILSAQSARQKMLLLFKYLAKKAGVKSGEKIYLKIPLTTQEIADMCSLTRETASLQLIKLKKEGVIIGRRNLVIDQAKLKKLAPV